MAEYDRVPENPVRISTEGRKNYLKLYKILKDSDRLQPGDEYSLTVLCEALADYDDFREDLELNGKTYQSGKMRRINPAWTALQDCLKSIREGATLFKMGPKHRERGEGQPSGSDPMAEINKILDRYGSGKKNK